MLAAAVAAACLLGYSGALAPAVAFPVAGPAARGPLALRMASSQPDGDRMLVSRRSLATFSAAGAVAAAFPLAGMRRPVQCACCFRPSLEG
jgi:hypothetical protein